MCAFCMMEYDEDFCLYLLLDLIALLSSLIDEGNNVFLRSGSAAIRV